MGKRILLICNTSNSVINFRKDLILALQEKTLDVFVIVGDSQRYNEIEKLGVNQTVVPMNNRDKNPFKIIQLKRRLARAIRRIQPDVVLTFQIKPNTIGSLAARQAKVDKIACMVEGLGDPFSCETIRQRILRFIVSTIYRKSLKHVGKVFFLNEDDKAEMVKRKIVKPEKCIVVPGIGIDTSTIQQRTHLPKDKRIIYLARLIRNKGILDYCQVARTVKKERADILFDLYGEEAQLKKEDLMSFIDDGSIAFHGYTTKSLEKLANSRLLVTTSKYREGFPRIILEAMAVGIPVIGSDTVGTKDAIIDGKTGYIVKQGDINAFAKAILSIIDDDQKLIKMGAESRHYAETRFDSKIINAQIICELCNL